MAPQVYTDPPLPPPPPPPLPPLWDDPRYSTMRRDRPNESRSTTISESEESAASTSTPTTSTDSDYSLYSAAAITSSKSRPSQYSGIHGPPGPSQGPSTVSSAVWGAAGAVATLAVICIIAGCCLFFCRKSRKRRNARGQMPPPPQQMVKTNGQSITPADMRAYAPSSTTLLPPSLSHTSSSTASVPPTQNEEAPILLSTNIDRSYYTGIDTSDVLSVVDHQRPPSNDIGDAGSITEPPPPYRPTSIPSFSRENSCRMSGAPPSYRPRLSLINTENTMRSPFDDPDGDSPISQVGGASNSASPLVRDMEEMSDVSDLSYQQEPVQVRSSL